MITPAKLASQGVAAEEIALMADRRDLLSNLQLLEGPENIAKSNTPPEEWAREAYSTDHSYSAYLDRNQSPQLPAAPDEFNKWFDARSEMLTVRLRSLLDSAGHPSAPVVDERPARRDDELAHSELPTP